MGKTRCGANRQHKNNIKTTYVQCVLNIFVFNNFFHLNGVSNYFGYFLDLEFSNSTKVCAENSEIVFVFCDPYHPALEILFSINSDVPLIGTP